MPSILAFDIIGKAVIARLRTGISRISVSFNGTLYNATPVTPINGLNPSINVSALLAN